MMTLCLFAQRYADAASVPEYKVRGATVSVHFERGRRSRRIRDDMERVELSEASLANSAMAFNVACNGKTSAKLMLW